MFYIIPSKYRRNSKQKRNIRVDTTDLTNDMGRIDFICPTETFMKKGSEPNLYLSRYKLASCFSRRNQRRGGSCVLVKSDLDYTPLKIPCQLASAEYFECCGIELTGYHLIVICIYRIPNSDIQIFFEKLAILLNKVCNNSRSVIVCGDWNIDMLKNNNQTRELKTILLNHGLYPHINVPTRKFSSKLS